MTLIDEILASTDIVDIVSDYVNLKKSGKNYIGLCPFHQEKTPSFVVSPDKQIFKCFGCGKGGNVITFIKEIENVEFFDAIKILANKIGLDISKYQNNFSSNKSEISLKENLIKLNKTALNFFHKQIFENENALNYLLKERKLNKEIIIKYKLGYSPKNSQELIKYLKEKGFSEDLILKAGLGKKSSSGSLYAFFTNRIIFPIFNSIGEVVAFSGRIFEEGTGGGKYINTPETIIYHKSNILYNFNNAKKTKKDYIIVCEGYMDVIGLDRLGFDNAVATCGTALTNQHIKLLKRITPNIIFAFDSDSAGEQASLRGLQIALQEGVYPKIFHIPEGKDFDELANLKENDNNFPQELETQILNSMDGVEFFINKFLENYKNSSPTEKEKKLQNIFEIIKNISNYSIFWEYLEKIAEKININSNILYQQFKNIKHYKQKVVSNQNNPNTEYVIPSLFYDNFFEKFNSSKFEEILAQILEILDFLPEENLLKKVLLNQITSEEKEKLLQEQLQWEENLAGWTKDKIEQKLVPEIRKYLINLLTNLAKHPINPETKLIIIKNLNKLRKV